MRHTAPLALVLVLFFIGCGNGDGPAEPPQPGLDVDPEDSTILELPFTADEIRAEWVPGLRILMRRSLPDRITAERWTVLAADDEGAEIEFATIADDGSVEGEPAVMRSTWAELRDHAAFPASRTTREWIGRSTALGDFEGWLYRVDDPDAATVQEFFFVPALPGAPVQMRILQEEETILELEQTARLRPESE
jgi:hypothetical protein